MVTLMLRGAIHGELHQVWGIRGSVVLWASKVVVEGLTIVMPTIVIELTGKKIFFRGMLTLAYFANNPLFFGK